jgi:hypothetical protein
MPTMDAAFHVAAARLGVMLGPFLRLTPQAFLRGRRIAALDITPFRFLTRMALPVVVTFTGRKG